jgi:dTDP-4-dehydrorhamnose 3,5-epimerase
MSRFQIKDLSLPGLQLVQFHPLGDARGSFTRLFCSRELGSIWPGAIVQINHTQTATRGTVRGLHFQKPPHAERKLVTCLRGEVWDVVVDVRAGSPTFLKWHAETLSAANRRAMLIPEGFAHGFQTISDGVEMLYFTSAAYMPEAEGGLLPTDPILGIPWPSPITLISDRDQAHPLLEKHFTGLSI